MQHFGLSFALPASGVSLLPAIDTLLLDMSPLSSSKEKEAMNEKARIKFEDEKVYGGTGDDLSFEETIENGLPTTDKHALQKNSRHLLKTRGSFWEDAQSFHEGAIPQSVVLAVVVGIVCGTVAFVYYYVLELLLEVIWKTLPEKYVRDTWPEWAHVLWIPLVGFILCIGVGVSVVFLGDPGDLPYTIKCVHDKGYLEMSHVLPMVAASQFSILGGGSLGPEAPLVAVCAALGGFISRRIFKQTNRNVVRKHTLMGMAGALAAFFGCPLGGSLFALEVNSRFGVEYFEHIVESILCGEVCLIVFRSLARLPIEPIWIISLPHLSHTTPIEVLAGCALGLVGAVVAYCFAVLHWRVMDVFSKFDLLRDERAVYRGLAGGTVILGLGVMIPHTLFWGENEIQTIASLSPASTLPHVWPTSGAFGFEMDSTLTCFIVGLAKLVAISFTVAGGYRGGYIFPFFAAVRLTASFNASPQHWLTS